VTVAAVVLFAEPEGALADAAGRVAARRIVESAWAGGATPIVVVAADPSGELATALAGSPAVLAEPAPPGKGPVGQIVRGMEVAADTVTETDAALVWPGRMAWVDAETVTTLIEAHGARRAVMLRPRYEEAAGWPVLVPLDVLPLMRERDAKLMPDDVIAESVTGGAALELIDTGDPGVAHDISTGLDALPPYQGPAEPGAGPPPDWGAAAAEVPDETPLAGPRRAPYEEAATAELEAAAGTDEASTTPDEEPAGDERKPAAGEAGPPSGEQEPTSGERKPSSSGLAVLQQATSVLMVDWPAWSVPDALVRAGFQVASLERDDEYFSYDLEEGEILRHGPIEPPSRIDIVYAHRPLAELEGIVAQAQRLGARAVWLQSGIDRPYEAEESRRIVEAAGLAYFGDESIADTARQINRVDEDPLAGRDE
jgi:CTP:molybdopterin cytidylyltransferase MocA/predicted CoA-binding protein